MSVAEGYWDPRFEPARKNRFRVGYVKTAAAEGSSPVLQSSYWWWAQAVTLPSFEINDETYQLVNRKFRYPGLLTWNDVQITLHEKGDQANFIVNDLLAKAGYYCGPGTDGCQDQGILKGGFYNNGDLFIEEITHEGKTLQKFDLKNWFIKGANFGELSMDSDELLTIQLTIGYDCAFVSTTLNIE